MSCKPNPILFTSLDLKYIKPVAIVFPYEEYEQPPVCEVELWDFSLAPWNKESMIEAVTTVASISYGNEQAKNPRKLFQKLIELGHVSPFEFVKLPLGDTIIDARNNDLIDCESISVTGYIQNTDLAIEFDITSETKNTLIELAKKYEQSKLKEAYDQCIATFKMTIPIFVFRQIVRHRTFSYMEMSRRYTKNTKVPFTYWTPNRKHKTYDDNIINVIEKANICYNQMVESKKYKPEEARAIIPVGAYTKVWMQGDYKAWLNFFIHRLHDTSQEETRLVALAMWNLLKEHQPQIFISMACYLPEWIENCNKIFRESQIKKALWFIDNYLLDAVKFDKDLINKLNLLKKDLEPKST